jgi:hypothetical protein
MSNTISQKEEQESAINKWLHGSISNASQWTHLIGYYAPQNEGLPLNISSIIHREKDTLLIHDDKYRKLERQIQILRKSMLAFRKPHGYPINYKYGIRKSHNKIKYRLESPFGEEYFNIIFEKNSYISSEKDAWKIIYIINSEKTFEDTLQEFNYSINKNFIELLFQKSDQYFYIDKFSQKIFTSKISSTAHYEIISLYHLLKYLDINEIENLIEKGSIAYAS